MFGFLLYFVSVWIFVNGINWHTSQVILTRLYDLQNEQFDVIIEYLDLEVNRIQKLESVLIPIFDWYIRNIFVKDDFILGHTNHLRLMTRIFSNQQKIRDLMNNEESLKALKTFDESKAISESNIILTYKAIRRLQRVYAISASDMAAGRNKDQIIGDPLNACNCYVMAECCFKDHDWYGVTDWGIQAYNKWSKNGRPECINIENLQYFLLISSTYTGFDYKTLSNSKEFLFSHSENAEKFVKHFSLMEKEWYVQNIDTQSDIFDSYDAFEYFERNIRFRQLCRIGKSTRTLTKESKCRYQTKNSPYRLLMPFKEEDISSNPYVKMYHDVLSDEEIRFVTEMAKEDLKDAKYYIDGNVSLIEDRRSGQLKWFDDSSNEKYFDNLNKRIECITEFSTKTAEGYQTVNYGVGGHFSVHVDAFTDGLKMYGNRLVTVLFYMTDVYDNGYTVFPNLNFVAPCRKGSALVWQNLHLSNGSVHSGTYHGGCPMLKGNKWIMTKGLYEGGQSLPYNWRNNKNIIIV